MHRYRSLLLILLLAGFISSAQAQQGEARALLGKGIELFDQGRYREAIDAFGSLLADPRASAERPDAAYWSSLAYLALGDRDNAEKAIDAFLEAYPSSPRVPDLLYQRGRILYSREDYEGALRIFAAFAESAPDSDLLPAALYWSGECLFALGRLEDAERAFAAVMERYPSSVKVEAASYRRSLIQLEYRERELLRLLTWSHEESLRAVEDFRRRERAYEQAISAYQKQISDARKGATTDKDTTIADLRGQVADLSTRLADAEARLSTAAAESEALRAALAKAQEVEGVAAVPSSTADGAAEALAAKARALELLAFYIERLAKEEGTK